jgi:DNA-binding NarL/FixJ family response regulator
MRALGLTSRQQQVCDLLARGFSNKEIATALGIDHRTVEGHRAVIFEKMHVRNAVELVRQVLLIEGKLA